MASWVLSQCGLKPLPQMYPPPRIRPISYGSSRPRYLYRNRGVTNLRFSSIEVSTECSGQKLRVTSECSIKGGTCERKTAAPPPFKLADTRAAIPKHCWVKDPWRSMSYVVVVCGLAAAAAYLNNWVVWPLYWADQGTMF